jgi:hypothetical protein
MINKGELQSIISKYSLGGMIDAVKWTTQDKQLNIKFNAPTRDMIGEVTHTKFDLEDSEIAIYNTSQLDKLLSITYGSLSLGLIKTGKIFSKLIIEDASFTVDYPLADLLLIQEPGKVKDPNNYLIECNIDSSVISAIIKAKNALQSDNVRFTTTKNFDGDQVLTMVFGDNSAHTNKIEYIVPDAQITGDILNINLPFNSEMIRVIMAHNRDAEKATMNLSLDGLLKLTFEGENWKSTYYIVRKADQ